MGDKHRSEIQKPVKNTLLSGASHGFPFESFHGSSMLIPVSQDSPSVLNDNACETDDGNAAIAGGGVQLIPDSKTGKIPEEKTSSGETRNSPRTGSQGYAGIFDSFFGGGSQQNAESKPDLDFVGKSDRISETFAPAGFHHSSSAPAVNATTIQTVSPVLQVPGDSIRDSLSYSTPVGFVHSSGSPFQRTLSDSRIQVSNDKSEEIVRKNDFSQATDFSPMVREPSDPFRPVEGSKFSQNERETASESGKPNHSFASNVHFEPYTDSRIHPPCATFTARATSESPAGKNSDSSIGSAASLFNPIRSRETARDSDPNYYQPFSGGSESFLRPNLPGISSSSEIPFPMNPSTVSLPSHPPPMSTSITWKLFRRDHQKRMTYAPVPGLTSDTAVSTSYLLPRDNFSSFTSLPIPPADKYSISATSSQPSMNTSTDSISTEQSDRFSASASSLRNYFATNRASSNGNVSGIPNDYQRPSNLPSSVSADSDAPIETFPERRSPQSPILSPVYFSNDSASSAVVTGHVINSASYRPPIMSTKEQASSTSQNPEECSSPSVVPTSLYNLANVGQTRIVYRPAYHHWFVRTEVKDGKDVWQPFSMTDSLALEQALGSDSLTPETVVPTDGSRYDVNVVARIRTAVYWEEKPQKVMRCSWFYKGTTESRLHPYDENTAYNLEEEYKKAVMANAWNKKIVLPNGDHVIMYGPKRMALFRSNPQTPEGWEADTDWTESGSHRPKIIKRGVLDDFEIEDGEPSNVDHLIFVVHGIGSVCDLKFRTIKEAVDVFRYNSLQLIKSHFQNSSDRGTVNRIEILPVSWHGHLHGETTGVDTRLQTITLKSIPRLRNFTNDTLLDILFYTSPVYCEAIMQQVGREINTLFAKFKSRNPSYNGGVSLVGHSLGSLILFDMLCHQKPIFSNRGNGTKVTGRNQDQEAEFAVLENSKKSNLSRKVSYVIGTAGTGQPCIEYPQLDFQPVAFFALGSPIGMFVTVRGIDSFGLDFSLPTCSRFFNIFHPFDPVAYRIEALVNPELSEKRPVLIPHHKGRKRMHLELKETMARVGADLKQRLLDSVRSTWNTVYQLTTFGRADDGLEQEVDQVIEKQLERQQLESAAQCFNEDAADNEVDAGILNQGRRIDYVLQEAPLESFNEYLSALTSHAIYWNSEDTMLFILKEVYSSMGISPDNQMPGVSGVQEEMATMS